MSAPSILVTRDVETSIDELAPSFDRLPRTITAGRHQLTLARRETRCAPLHPGDAWRSIPATMRTGRFHAPFAVSVEATPWSPTRSQVVIRPESPACLRRPVAFCAAAHTLANQVQLLVLARLAGTSEPVVAPPPRGQLACSVEEVDRLTLVRLAGDLDHANLPRFRREVVHHVQSRPQDVRIDLAGVRSIDVAAVATMVQLTRAVEQGAGDATVTLFTVPDAIREGIHDSGLSELLNVA